MAGEFLSSGIPSSFPRLPAWPFKSLEVQDGGRENVHVGLKIGELAQATGTTAPTFRYYEEIGLLPSPARVGGQRRYGEDDVRRLTFFRRCRDFGFPIDRVRMLASLMGDRERSCGDARDLAEAHLRVVREKLRELHGLEYSIAGFIEAADAVCPGGSGADCVVLERLSEPTQR